MVVPTALRRLPKSSATIVRSDAWLLDFARVESVREDTDMCGITGFYTATREVDASRYYAAHLSLRHRGPDDEGFVACVGGRPQALSGDDTISHFGGLPHVSTVSSSRVMLGHRRLSIIDLSWHGHEPFCSSDEQVWLTYNGEVYNYLELREELRVLGHGFDTGCDTEVVLKAYLQWGTDCFSRFNGMWAIAIWDRRDERLVLSRDRFGIKPLYYSVLDGVLYFGSEMKFIRGCTNESYSVNSDSVTRYLQSNMVSFSEHTFWQGIDELEPGRFLVFQDGRVEIGRYWNVEPRLVVRDHREAVEEFGRLFTESLRLRMRSDVEVGTLLSGGLDSSLIVCQLDALGLLESGEFKTFSADFDEAEFSERRYMDAVTAAVPVEQHVVRPRWEELNEYLPKLLHHIEEPFNSLSVYSQHVIYETVHRDTGVRVLLNGQGADELFGGYTRHYYVHFAGLIHRGQATKAIREMVVFAKERGISLARVVRWTRKYMPDVKRDPNFFAATLLQEVEVSALRQYLKYDDRNSSAYGLEARVPFLDYRLVEFAASLGEESKIDGWSNKRVERDHARGVVPDLVVSRKDKMGFVSPQKAWQQEHLHDRMISALEVVEDSGILREVPKGDWYAGRYRDYLSGRRRDAWALAWRIYCLAQWLESNSTRA